MAKAPKQSVIVEQKHPFEDGVGIISSKGIFYVSLRMDRFLNFSTALIPFVIWLDSLDEAQQVILSVVTPRNVPAYGPHEYITLIGALLRCKAHISIKMDHYEPTQASYLYLAADTVIAYPAGAIFFGPTTNVVQNDTVEVKPVFIPFINSLVDRALASGFLSSREADAIRNSTPIGLMYKDIVSRDLSVPHTGLDIRE